VQRFGGGEYKNIGARDLPALQADMQNVPLEYPYVPGSPYGGAGSGKGLFA
jgi:hypothetical protein